MVFLLAQILASASMQTVMAYLPKIGSFAGPFADTDASKSHDDSWIMKFTVPTCSSCVNNDRTNRNTSVRNNVTSSSIDRTESGTIAINDVASTNDESIVSKQVQP